MEEKGKRISRRARIGMDFDLKTSKLHIQEAVDKYLASYGFPWSPGIKIEFYMMLTFFRPHPARGGVYASPGVGARIKAVNDEVHLQHFDFL